MATNNNVFRFLREEQKEKAVGFYGSKDLDKHFDIAENTCLCNIEPKMVFKLGEVGSNDENTVLNPYIFAVKVTNKFIYGAPIYKLENKNKYVLYPKCLKFSRLSAKLLEEEVSVEVDINVMGAFFENYMTILPSSQ